MRNQNNKSFILHTDGLEVIDQLSDQQAGKLFKAIISYQRTGEIPKLDQTNTIILTPLLKQFKRDKEKYHQSIIQGKLGNLKKYHGKIYQKVINKEITLEEGESLAYPEKSIKSILSPPPIEHDQSGSHNINVNDNINYNIDNSLTNKKELKTQFESFWELYDKKTSRADAERKFKAALKKESYENILAGLERYTKARGNDKKFWKNPSTWLYQECWSDEYESSKQELPKPENLVFKFNKFMGYEFACKVNESDNQVIIQLRANHFKTQIDNDTTLQSKLKEFFKNKEVKFTW